MIDRAGHRRSANLPTRPDAPALHEMIDEGRTGALNAHLAQPTATAIAIDDIKPWEREDGTHRETVTHPNRLFIPDSEGPST
jgi:hypothetical protein